MKGIFTTLFVALAVTMVSCTPDVNHDLPASSFYIVGMDEGQEIVDAVFFDMQTTGELKVNAYLGGYFGANGSVKLVADDNLLLKYNEDNGTSFGFLPEEAFSLSDEAINVSPESRAASFVCSIDCDYLRTMKDLEDYLLPLTLVSDNLPLNPDKKSVLYRFSVRELTLLMNNPGVQEVHLVTGGDTPSSVPVSVVTDGDDCAVDYDYQFHCLEATTDVIANIFGYGRMAPADSWTIETDNIVKKGTKESVSQIVFDMDKLPAGISYLAVALDDDDLTQENILTKANVYRIFKDAEIMPREEWTIPYCNVMAKGGAADFGTHLLLDGDLATIWQAPWNDRRNGYDKHYEKWQAWDYIAPNRARLPMFCILDMSQAKTISGVKVSRRVMTEANASLTKTGEIWVSNDTSGDDVLPNPRKNIEGDINVTEAESQAWNAKKFTKVAEFDFSAVNNNLNQDIVVYFDAQEARYVKVCLTDEENKSSGGKPILALSEINVLGKH